MVGDVNSINRRNIPFDIIKYRLNSPKKLIRTKNHPILGFDTETYKGYVKLIADSDGDYLWNPDREQLLQFLTRKKTRGTHNFFYNLNYDVDSILKSFPESTIREINKNLKTKWNEYTIKSVPDKYFSITVHKNTSTYYDLAQFFDISLDEAGRRFLNEPKIELPFDRNTLNTIEEVWEDYPDLILKYCIHDAVLCARLAKFLQKTIIDEIGMIPQRFVSKAYLSKQYFRNTCTIPALKEIPREALKVAFYAYKGGRFENIQKGYFPYAESYDIISAYPYEIANLLDITKGKWRYTKTLHTDATYGFYYTDVKLNFRVIEPLAYYNRAGTLIYPAGSFKTCATKEELIETLHNTEYSIIRGWEFYAEEEVYPFRDAINYLFQQKAKYPKTSYKYSLYKIMLNSLYGTTYEKYERDDYIQAGLFFNPIYATLITRNTAVKLYKFAQEYPDDVIAFATDSVILKEKHNIKTGDSLGDWKKEEDKCGETIVIMTGLYVIGGKIKTKGFTANSPIITEFGKFKNLFEYIKAKPELSEYNGIIERPVHRREALFNRKDLSKEDINTWKGFPRLIDINKDNKRVWLKEFKNGGELLKKSIKSIPVYVNH